MVAVKASQSVPKKPSKTHVWWRLTVGLLVYALSVGLMVVGLRFLIRATFSEIEVREMQVRVNFIKALIKTELHALEVTTRDWAAWDDTYQFMEDTNQAYIDSNMHWEAMEGLGFSTMLMLDLEGRVVYGITYDLETGILMATPSGLLDYFDPGGLKLLMDGVAEPLIAGLVRLEEGLFLAASYPVLPSSREGESKGYLVFGKRISEVMVESWSETVDVELELDVQQTTLPMPGKEYTNKLILEEVEIEPVNKHIIEVRLELIDIYGRGVGTLRVFKDREVLVQGLRMGMYAEIGVVLVTLLAGLGVYWLWLKLGREGLAQAELLVVKVREIEASNQALERNKLAMLNLLEDARELEEELKREKAGVELKVEERTRDLREKTNALEQAQTKISEGWMQQQREKARLQASIQALPLGLLILDKEHRVVMFNRRLREILGMSDEVNIETIKKVFLDNGFDIHSVCPLCRGEAAILRREEQNFAAQILRIEGVPVMQDNQAIGVVMLFEDISEAKKLQRTRDEFFAVASHELRTPLTAIRGNTSMLMEYYPQVMENGKVKEMVEDIHSASLRLISIVNDFLDASRLELHKMEIKIEKVDLRGILTDAMRELEPSALGKKLAWELTFEGEENYIVLADKARLQQVLINLLGNAMKFTEEGGVYVTVKPEGEGKVVVRARDTGRGIEAEDQKKLFRKYTQVGGEGLARNVTQGAGMGLYISKLLMDQMGGEVFLEQSEVGGGSTFGVRVPLCEE